jgi:hypothetical protein
MTTETTYELQAETVITFCANEHVELAWAMSSDSDFCATCDQSIPADGIYILEGTVVAKVEWDDSQPLPFGIEL